MGLTDVHSVYGFVLGKLFHAHAASSADLVIPAKFPPALVALLTKQQRSRAPLARYVLAGIVLSNLPDVDVIVAAALRNWGKHRGPTHSLLFLVLSSLCATAPLSYWLRTSRVKALLLALVWCKALLLFFV